MMFMQLSFNVSVIAINATMVAYGIIFGGMHLIFIYYYYCEYFLFFFLHLSMYFLFQAVFHNWIDKGHDMCYPLWDGAYEISLAANRNEEPM